MNRPFVLGTLVLVSALLPAWRAAVAEDDENSKVLGSIHIAAGQHAKDATTVNGSVDIGANAIVSRAETVNGSITLGQNASAASLQTVNGSARLEQGARVAGGVELVNGHIALAREVDVTGRLTSVNGAIQLVGAHVGGGIETTNGDIDIGPNSRVEGGILVDKSNEGWFSFGSPKIPRIVIGPGAVVQGPLKFLREVKLYVSDRAKIGPVEGAAVIKFTGDHPPD